MVMQNTYYVVRPFILMQEGILSGPAQQVPSAACARRLGERIGGNVVGLLAFSHSYNPRLEEWDDAVILGIYGDVPEEMF